MSNITSKGGKVPDTKRIVFLGDSITDDGTYIAHMSYYFLKYMPDKILEFINLGVSSETVSGLSEPEHPFPRPCVHDRIDRALELSKPEWVVVCYGMNDGIYYPYGEERFNAYKKGMLTLIEKIKILGAKVIVMTPPVFDADSFTGGKLQPEGMKEYSYMNPYRAYSEVLRLYGEWVLKDIHGIADKVIDLYTPVLNSIHLERSGNPRYIYGDGIHPDIKGHWVIAKTLLSELFNISLEREPDYLVKDHDSTIFNFIMQRHRLLSSAWKEYVGHTNPCKAEALPLEQAVSAAKVIEIKIHQTINPNEVNYKDNISNWKGYKRHDFYLNGREGIFIEPKNFTAGNPWAWRAEFFDAFPYADMELLNKGWGLAYYRVSNLYGCSEAVEMMKGFHDFLVERFGLSNEAALLGFSRGGLYAVNYTAAYPQDVKVLYIDAPVLDIRSWPGGKGKGCGATPEWEECLVVYGLDEESVKTYSGIPLNKAKAIKDSGIPVIIVAGDADEVVPFEENSMLFAEELKQIGAKVKLIVKPGVAHHPHSLEDPQEIVEFIIGTSN